MKPIDVNNGRDLKTACGFCMRVQPNDKRSGHLSNDMRQFTCTAPHGIIAERVLIDEPCSNKDTEQCIVWQQMQKGVKPK